MKKEKQSFGEWFESATIGASTMVGVIIALVFASVFWGWFGFFLVVAGVSLVAILKGTGQIPDKWGE